jgi:tetratricopeptide (TPR) repeat protein
MRIMLTIAAALLLASSALAAPNPHEHAVSKETEINRLFTALSKIDNDEEAKPIEDKIMSAFLRSGSPTVDLLMSRAASALQAKDGGTANKLLASVNDIAPDFAEAWHQRGVLQSDAGDDEGAMFCLEKAIELNPRNFEAITELASQLEEYGDKPGALKLYRKAMALDPHFGGVARKVRELTQQVEGESL